MFKILDVLLKIFLKKFQKVIWKIHCVSFARIECENKALKKYEDLVEGLRMIVSLIKYSSLSNNRAGCNKRVGRKNLENFGDLLNQKMFKTHLRFF